MLVAMYMRMPMLYTARKELQDHLDEKAAHYPEAGAPGVAARKNFGYQMQERKRQQVSGAKRQHHLKPVLAEL